MKRWIVCAVVLASVLILSGNHSTGSDIAKMEPVEVIRISAQSWGICVETDTGRSGYGESLAAAVADMTESADRELFLDTADYLLLAKTAEPQVSELLQLVRPSCKMCIENGAADLSKVAAYLNIHDPQVTMKEYRISPRQLPVLTVTEGRMYLVQP